MIDPEAQTPQEQAQSPRPSRYWKHQIEASRKREEKWRKKAERVYKRYLDERDGEEAGMKEDDISRVNVLWSNTEVLKAVLFANLGKPDISRNFPKQGKDNKIARQAALILERAVSTSCDRYDVENEIEAAITDGLIAGRGTCWLELEANVEVDEESISDDTSEATGATMKLMDQAVEMCHVPYDDWTHGPGKKWEQVPWVARRHIMDKQDVAEQFGEELAEEVPQNFVLSEGEGRTAETGLDDFKRACLWEIWDKRSKSRIYVAEGYGFELERVSDPYKLHNFFPCPRPLYGVKVPHSLLPRPEYLQYQDQCNELDRINTRIRRLIEALKESGVYNAAVDDGDTLKNLNSLEDGEYIPWKNWASLAQGGGLAGAFQTRDTRQYAEAIQALAQRGQEIIQLIYEVTGISDVVRGATDPRETASAQRLKARFGTQRIQKRQKEIQRFVGDLYRMKAELIAEHFEPEQLAEMSGIEIPSNAEKTTAQRIIQLAKRIAQMQQQASQPAPQGQPQLTPPAPAAAPQQMAA